MRCSIFIVFAVIFSVISLVDASVYNLEFTQVGKDAVVKESINGIKTESYVLKEDFEKIGAKYYFIKKIIFLDNYENAEIKLNLDMGIILEKEEVFPIYHNTDSDGQTISIIWKLEDVKQGQEFVIFATLIDTKINYGWFYWLSAIIIVLIAGFFAYKKLKEKSKLKKAKEDYDYLLDTEKKVIEVLKSADRHEIWQKQIQNTTGFSKAKVSRLVRNLEARGLIVKIPFGNTNKVRLK